jgi:hypothetical protein
MRTFHVGERIILLQGPYCGEEVTICGVDHAGIRVARPTTEGVIVTLYFPIMLEQLEQLEQKEIPPR